MDLKEILTSFIIGIQQTTALEYIAVFTGIASTFSLKRKYLGISNRHYQHDYLYMD